MKLSQAGVHFRKNLPVSVHLSWPTFKGLVFSVSHRGDFRSVFPRGLVGRSTESSPSIWQETTKSWKLSSDPTCAGSLEPALIDRLHTHHTLAYFNSLSVLHWSGIKKKKMRTQRESAQRYRSRFLLNTQLSFTFSKQRQHSLRWLSKLSWFDYSSQRQKITHLFIGKYV